MQMTKANTVAYFVDKTFVFYAEFREFNIFDRGLTLSNCRRSQLIMIRSIDYQ